MSLISRNAESHFLWLGRYFITHLFLSLELGLLVNLPAFLSPSPRLRRICASKVSFVKLLLFPGDIKKLQLR